MQGVWIGNSRGITWFYPGSCIWTSENSYSTHSGELSNDRRTDDEPPSKWEDDIDCGPGRDTVYFDKGFDKLSRNCELKKPIRA
jgi:hypothetical protein